MKVNFKRPIIKRIRKPNTSIYKILRLNRAEYGHDFQSKKNSDIDQYGYYPDVTELINNLKKYRITKYLRRAYVGARLRVAE